MTPRTSVLKRRSTIVMLLLPIAVLVPHPTRAMAAGSCAIRAQPREGVGYVNNPARDLGATVQITVESGATCSVPPVGSNSGNMAVVHSVSGPNGSEYITGGYRRLAGEPTKSYVNKHYTDANGSHFKSMYGCAVYEPSIQYVGVYISTQFGVPFFGYDSSNSSGTCEVNLGVGSVDEYHADYFYEAGDFYESDIAGKVSDHNNWRGAGYISVSDGKGHPYPCGMTGYNDNSTRWARTALSCTGWDMWTK